MSLFLATPTYGGQCTTAFHESADNLCTTLELAGFPYDWLFTKNESLIQRARNSSVATFLKTDFERFMFIDADIDFTEEDVLKLWEMDADVACAAYSMKREDCPLSAWEGGDLVDIEDRTEPFEVDFAGTGFIMIKRHVFEDFVKEWPELSHIEGHVGQSFNWFNCRVEKVEEKIFLSEDYAFCYDFRRLGGKIMLNPTIKLGHWGIKRYG